MRKAKSFEKNTSFDECVRFHEMNYYMKIDFSCCKATMISTIFWKTSTMKKIEITWILIYCIKSTFKFRQHDF